MRRRAFLSGSVAALATPLAAEPQPKAVPRVGILAAQSSSDLLPPLDEFRQELRKLGWIEGQTVTVLPLRSAEGRNERLRELAAEVLTTEPRVIVVFSAPATRVLKQATPTIPLVMWAVGDPVEYGLVASLAKPGGNVTGTAYLVNEIAGKLVNLLKEAVPSVHKVAVFLNPTNPGGASYVRAARTVGQAMGVSVQEVDVRAPDDFPAAFAAIIRERSEAIILSPEALLRSQRRRVVEFSEARRLPLLLHGGPGLLENGGLLSYAPKSGEYPRVVASYVDRILKGAQPADLPVHQPTEFELAVNLKTAKALGLTIPLSLLARADQVIE
jgi:putative ABC transport system substrate-binding protein